MSHPTTNFFQKTWLYCTVFLTGAAVMVIELLGTRLIAPFYGASLYVWTSLIAVTLIALALGYYIGGIWADRAKRTGLSLIIAIAALLTLIIPWATGFVLIATDPLGLRMGTFVSTLVLFSPSLVMLGMIGPFAVKLSTSDLANVGASTGSIYAISTVGSVVGTLFLGFYLFPLVGSREIFIGLGVMLFLLAIVVAVFERSHLKLTTALLPIAILAAAGIILSPQLTSANHVYSVDGEFQTIFARESLYGWVRVIDNPVGNYRLLTVDASTIGAASISHGENILPYQDIVGLIPLLAPGMSRALLIGQGTGHMVMALKKHGIVTDTLEIDPIVAQAARDYFDFTPTGRMIIGDARYEIRQLDGPYDLIILDVFTGGSEPIHLLTVETMSQLQKLLSNRGILALNFVAFYEHGKNPALASVAKTLAQVFSHQLAFISDTSRDFNDFIFLATNQAINLEGEILTHTQKNWLKTRLLDIDQSYGVLMTDNLNPIETLQTRKAEYYRRIIVDSMGLNNFIR